MQSGSLSQVPFATLSRFASAARMVAVSLRIISDDDDGMHTRVLTETDPKVTVDFD